VASPPPISLHLQQYRGIKAQYEDEVQNLIEALRTQFYAIPMLDILMTEINELDHTHQEFSHALYVLHLEDERQLKLQEEQKIREEQLSRWYTQLIHTPLFTVWTQEQVEKNRDGFKFACAQFAMIEVQHVLTAGDNVHLYTRTEVREGWPLLRSMDDAILPRMQPEFATCQQQILEIASNRGYLDDTAAKIQRALQSIQQNPGIEAQETQISLSELLGRVWSFSMTIDEITQDPLCTYRGVVLDALAHNYNKEAPGGCLPGIAARLYVGFAQLLGGIVQTAKAYVNQPRNKI
jgi:hypothetical protein